MPTRPPRRRRRSSRARRFAKATVVLGIVVAVVAAVIAATGGTSSPKSPEAGRAQSPTAPSLHPPGPIPGYLLIADRGNNRMLLVDSAHRIWWRYPGGGRKAMPFVFDDDTFFGPHHDRIVSNQEDQDTIQIISFPGKRVLWRYGHVNVKSGAPGYLNTPDDAYLLPNRLVSVADAYNCRVLFIAPDHRIVRQYGTTGICRHDPPRYLGAVNGATPLPDGGTLISEIAGSWIDDIGPTGKLRWGVQAPVSYPSDPQLLGPNRILLADYSNPGSAIIMTRTGHVVWRYGPQHGPGALDHPSLATRIAPGLIAINDDYRDRVVLVSIRTRQIVWQYGHTDHAGTAPGYLNTPDGLDVLSTKAAQSIPSVRRLLTPHTASRRAAVSATPGAKSTTLRVEMRFRLPAPVEREVAVAHDGAIVIAGGLDAAGGSTSGVFRMSTASGRLTQLGAVPQAFHDAAGAVIGNALFVFGGGAAQSSSAVQRFDLGSRTGSVVAHLPRALSDVASASTANGVFLVGGYDGRTPRPEIYRTVDGRHFTEVGRLPFGLRYPAVAAVGSRLDIAGGTAARGVSDHVYAFDTQTDVLTSIGRLPMPTAHAEAFALGGTVYIAGGTDSAGTVVGAIYRVDSSARRIARVQGSLPVRDAATIVLDGSAWLVGGGDAAGTTSAVHRAALR